jgi:hypothetical protein
MVPTKNTVDLDRRLPNSQLVVYPDAGHGAACRPATTARQPRGRVRSRGRRTQGRPALRNHGYLLPEQ